MRKIMKEENYSSIQVTIYCMAFSLFAHTYPFSDCIFSTLIIVAIVFLLYKVSSIRIILCTEYAILRAQSKFGKGKS